MTSLSKARSATALYLVVISSSYPLASWLADKVDPLMTVLCRFWIAGAALGVIYIARNTKLPKLPQKDEWWRLLLLATPLALYFISTFTAAKTQSPVVLAVLFTIAPLTPVLVSFLRQQRASAQIVLSMFLGAVAAIYIAVGGSLEALNQAKGEPWLYIYILSCLLFTANPLLIKTVGRGMPLLWRSVWILLLSGAVMLSVLIISLAFDLKLIQTNVPSSDAWFAIIWISVICTAAPMFLYQYAAHSLDTIELGGWHFGLPVLVMLEQSIWMGRGLTSGEIIAALTIILALALLTTPLKRLTGFNKATNTP